MISWRLAVPAVLVAATVAGCITYFATPAPPQQAEADHVVAANLPEGDKSSRFGDIDEYSASK